MQKELIIAGDTSPDVNHDATNQSNGDIDRYKVINKDMVLLIIIDFKESITLMCRILQVIIWMFMVIFLVFTSPKDISDEP